jgi:hypothetical protein
MKLTLSKAYLLPAFILLLTLAMGCKKDAITVEANKTFREINVPPPTDPMFSNAMVVLLSPGGNAGISFGGDAIYPATYTISGKNLKIIDTGFEKTYKLKIISNTELNYEGRILRLEDN